MRRRISLSIAIALFTLSVSAQKIPLNNNSYDSWKSLSAPSLSDDGKWVTYIINPQQGDGYLYIINTVTGKKDSVARGSSPVFSPSALYAAYNIVPSYQAVRQAKKKKLKEDKMPGNDLVVRILNTDSTHKYSGVKSFAVADKNSEWMAVLFNKSASAKNNTSPSDTAKQKVSATKKKKAPEPKGTDLLIVNPMLGKEFRYNDVVEYSVSKDGGSISFTQVTPDTTKIDRCVVTAFDLKSQVPKTLFDGKGALTKLSSDKSGSKIAFLFSSDTAKIKRYELWLAENMNPGVKIADSTSQGFRKNWSVSENGNIVFSENGSMLFFGTAPKAVKQAADTLLEEEKYKLDIWSWDDDLLQPMQKKQLDSEKKRTFIASYNIAAKKLIQLADSSMPSIRASRKYSNDIVLGSSDLKYRRSSSWDGNSDEDVYFVNVKTGVRTSAFIKCPSRMQLSPAAKYAVFWNTMQKSWNSVDVKTGTVNNISSAIPYPLCDELNDLPDDPAPYGFGGWINDEKHILVFDRFDIWLLALDGSEKPVNITSAAGRTNNMRFRYVSTDPEEEYINRNKLLYLSSFNYYTKTAGFYALAASGSKPEKLIEGPNSFPGALVKAKDAPVLIWQKGSNLTSPELFVSDLSFNKTRQLSVTNPQQSDYIWASSELVEWTSFDNQKLQGILYKPENFDPSRKYPMIVYFYERSSDGIYSYLPPAPSASIINRTFAASNGYLVFVPDIPYTIGYPGQSCYNAVISGTVSLIDRYNFIDRTRLGLDGQSWGGCQIAWLVTQTDMFACAYAGAAVSNMISAYGGIRWGTGMSRMFQYEKTQSRIGGTLWEKPLQFVENSPIFWVPKIKTPLLLMHNDADDAVPWYQSIEFITALRRLDKPAWLLSYNDEAHNLVKRPNRKDISIRKMQFFDHYLKGEPMPYWMKYGISQTEKGKVDGYNLVNE